MTELVIPTIATPDGAIFKQYQKSYNRNLSAEDVEEIKALCDSNDLQKIIDNFNVRKITIVPNDLLKHVCKTNSLVLVKFITKKISYDDVFYNIIQVNKRDVSKEIQEYLQTKRSNYQSDYEGEWCEWE